jgi:hypothetical protein
MPELLDLLIESKPHKIMFSMLIIIILITVSMRIIEKKFKKEKKTDVEKLFDSSRCQDCSEFDIFQKTGKCWNIPQARIDEDFKIYLQNMEIPYYVRDYLRSVEKEAGIKEIQ